MCRQTGGKLSYLKLAGFYGHGEKRPLSVTQVLASAGLYGHTPKVCTGPDSHQNNLTPAGTLRVQNSFLICFCHVGGQFNKLERSYLEQTQFSRLCHRRAPLRHNSNIFIHKCFPLHTLSYVKWTQVYKTTLQDGFAPSQWNIQLCSPRWNLDESQECALLAAQPLLPQRRPHFTCRT